MLAREDITAAGVTPMALDDLFAWADVISIHVPLTDGTRGLIGAAELARMQSSAIIVNCSRGGIIDERALAEALKNGAIGGAGIDVFEAEPPSADNPLFDSPNIVLSPHVAGVTESGMKGMATACADAIDAIVTGGRPANLLNPEVLK
jgi:phosphoglycerate dehydrogenase-like enzyme